MSKLLEALRFSVDKIEAELNNSKLRTHNGDIGTIREKIIVNFLRPYLPDCYSIGSGQIFDSEDNMSNQIDIILFDQIFSTVLFKDEETLLLPYESVYGTVEVKSYLNSNELDIALKNIASVRMLKREDSDSSFILPHIGSIVSKRPGNIINFDESRANNPLNIIFAYDGLKAETCLEKLNNKFSVMTFEDKQLMPDFIFNFKKGYMITKGQIKDNEWWIALRNFNGVNEYDGYFKVETSKDTLALFYLTLNSFMDKIRLNALNSTKYWNDIFKGYCN